MAWVKLADGFLFHPKARAAGKDGRALFVASLCWAAGSETKGVIYTRDLPLLATAAEVKPAISKRLVEVGFWEIHPDGWLIHDYHEYNPTPEAIEDRRRKRAEAGRKGGLKSRPPGSKPEASASANGEANQEAEEKQTANPYSYSYSTDDSHHQTTSSCGEPDKSDDDEQQPVGRQERAIAACDLLGDQAYDAAFAAGKVQTSTGGYRRSCRESAHRDHLEAAQLLANANRRLTVEELAAELTVSDTASSAEIDVGSIYHDDDARRREWEAEQAAIDPPTTDPRAALERTRAEAQERKAIEAAALEAREA